MRVHSLARMDDLKRLEEERRRREEEDRLRWMRETEERRRLVQQHMANLKRQRALEAERCKMAKEDALALAVVREERRFVHACSSACSCVFVYVFRSLLFSVDRAVRLHVGSR